MQEEAKAKELEERAEKTFSAERREDYAVLIVAAIVVILVMLGIIDKKVISAIYLLKY
ncbi:MAG: hypothetical protein N2327_06190 [Caldimicrobium sp.]|nr:hypothetical protein [Caldimicrobium sp.]MCX7874001.1 hypothetical protein [Caldimicrobium sp.]MDW8094149.1 hypothetical protein [Caldimicrobium sp.]